MARYSLVTGRQQKFLDKLVSEMDKIVVREIKKNYD